MNIFTLTILVFLFREVTVCHFYIFLWLHASWCFFWFGDMINIWSTPLRSKAWREDARACLGDFSSGDGRSGSIGLCWMVQKNHWKNMAFHAVMWEIMVSYVFCFFCAISPTGIANLCKDKHKMTGAKSITGESFWDFIWVSWGALRFPKNALKKAPKKGC